LINIVKYGLFYLLLWIELITFLERLKRRYKLEKDVLRVEINAQDQGAFIKLLRDFPLDTAAERQLKNGKIVAEAYVPSSLVETLQKPGIEIKVLDNAVKTGMERQKEVSSDKRFALDDGGNVTVPRGLGKKE
jgi:hypothetical protein